MILKYMGLEQKLLGGGIFTLTPSIATKSTTSRFVKKELSWRPWPGTGQTGSRSIGQVIQ